MERLYSKSIDELLYIYENINNKKIKRQIEELIELKQQNILDTDLFSEDSEASEDVQPQIQQQINPFVSTSIYQQVSEKKEYNTNKDKDYKRKDNLNNDLNSRMNMNANIFNIQKNNRDLFRRFND